jgi:hypothetical protein
VKAALTLALVAAFAAALATPAVAQTSTRDAKLGTFVHYGLDAERLRLDSIQRVDRIDGRPYVRTVEPGSGRVGYVILTFTVDNDRAAPGYIPALVITLMMDKGPAIDPAVYGPFLGNATQPIDLRTTIRPHGRATLHLVVIDVPNGRAVREIIVSPNDATAQYRFRPKPSEIVPLAAVPR